MYGDVNTSCHPEESFNLRRITGLHRAEKDHRKSKIKVPVANDEVGVSHYNPMMMCFDDLHA